MDFLEGSLNWGKDFFAIIFHTLRETQLVFRAFLRFSRKAR